MRKNSIKIKEKFKKKITRTFKKNNSTCLTQDMIIKEKIKINKM